MRSCANISIVDDRVVEDTETFIVSLRSTGGEQVRLTDPMSTTVNILDNDGKMFFFHHTLLRIHIINFTTLFAYILSYSDRSWLHRNMLYLQRDDCTCLY